MKTFDKVFKTKYLAMLAIAALMAAALVGLSGCGGSGDSSSDSSGDDKYADLDAVTLIMADNTSKGAAGNLWGEEIAAQASEITGGKLTLDYHPNSELGGDSDLLRQEQANDIQVVIAQPGSMTGFVSDLAVFDLPMAFANYDADQIESVLNGDNEFTQGLQASFEDADLHSLGWLQNGTYRMTTSNKDLSTLANFKGFQIRTMENSNSMTFWSALGAEPTPLAWSETYFALQNGTVDGQENAADTCVGASLQEVQDYLCATNHTLYTNNISINKEAWESLDPAYQEALTQAIANATETMRPQLTELNDSNIKTMTDAGMTYIEYDQSFFDEILALDDVQALYSSIGEQTNGLADKLVSELEKTA